MYITHTQTHIYSPYTTPYRNSVKRLLCCRCVLSILIIIFIIVIIVVVGLFCVHVFVWLCI